MHATGFPSRGLNQTQGCGNQYLKDDFGQPRYTHSAKACSAIPQIRLCTTRTTTEKIVIRHDTKVRKSVPQGELWKTLVTTEGTTSQCFKDDFVDLTSACTAQRKSTQVSASEMTLVNLTPVHGNVRKLNLERTLCSVTTAERNGVNNHDTGTGRGCAEEKT